MNVTSVDRYTSPTTDTTSTHAVDHTVDYNTFLQLLIAADEEPGSDQSDGHVAIHEPVRATVLGRAGHADQHEARYAAVLHGAVAGGRADRPHGVASPTTDGQSTTGKIASVSINSDGSVATLEDGTKVTVGPGSPSAEP